ncbi:hypothetical protein LOAG_08514 [Loa loa]|uniref:Uncharacterized protein n=1 Tax=Loa loa TaxID=7209 RepID=A0A1S0TTN3_LOALO|nr:hypothetical protein LOAG_08514 [Loa loa]EFO19978.1 hypothetical protein LOAG_08514 [Loa loa]
MSYSIYYFIVSVVCTTPSVVFVCYKKKDKSNKMRKNKSTKDIEKTESAIIFSSTQSSCKKPEECKEMMLDKTQEITVNFYKFQQLNELLSIKSTQTEKGSSARSNNTYQMVVTQSTQDDSVLARGRGTSIYEKMTKEQMLQAGKKQFNKLNSDTKRKSTRLGKPARSVILSRRLVKF